MIEEYLGREIILPRHSKRQALIIQDGDSEIYRELERLIQFWKFDSVEVLTSQNFEVNPNFKMNIIQDDFLDRFEEVNYRFTERNFEKTSLLIYISNCDELGFKFGKDQIMYSDFLKTLKIYSVIYDISLITDKLIYLNFSEFKHDAEIIHLVIPGEIMKVLIANQEEKEINSGLTMIDVNYLKHQTGHQVLHEMNVTASSNNISSWNFNFWILFSFIILIGLLIALCIADQDLKKEVSRRKPDPNSSYLSQ